MGYRLEWLAVRGKDASKFLGELGLQATGEFADVFDGPVCGAMLSDGWYVVIADSRVDLSARWDELSIDAELVACDVNETVMSCCASYWKQGREIWAIERDSQTPEGFYHLEARGNLPAEYVEIRDQYLAKQRSVNDTDYIFEVPLEVAKLVTGFKHDEDIDGDDEPFEQLERQETSRKWWQFWK